MWACEEVEERHFGIQAPPRALPGLRGARPAARRLLGYEPEGPAGEEGEGSYTIPFFARARVPSSRSSLLTLLLAHTGLARRPRKALPRGGGTVLEGLGLTKLGLKDE